MCTVSLLTWFLHSLTFIASEMSGLRRSALHSTLVAHFQYMLRIISFISYQVVPITSIIFAFVLFFVLATDNIVAIERQVQIENSSYNWIRMEVNFNGKLKCQFIWCEMLQFQLNMDMSVEFSKHWSALI